LSLPAALLALLGTVAAGPSAAPAVPATAGHAALATVAAAPPRPAALPAAAPPSAAAAPPIAAAAAPIAAAAPPTTAATAPLAVTAPPTTAATVPLAATAPPAAAPPAAAPPAACRGTGCMSVTVALPARSLTVGDRAEALITLRVPAAARLAGEPRFPAWRGAWGEAEVRRQEDPQRRTAPDGGAVYSQRLVLAAFHPGRVALPPVPIAVPLRAGTVQAWTPPSLALAVRSVLPAGAAAASDLRPRPPAPLRQLPLGAPFLWTLAILAAVAAAGIWALWRRARRRRAAAGAEARARPLLAPLPELLAALDRLAAEPSPEVLHTGISQALRRYLGRTVGFPAPESTTTEIHRLLLAHGWTSARVRPAVELLRACDLVKFARQHAPTESARHRLAAARRLGEEIAAHAAAVAEAGARLEAAG